MTKDEYILDIKTRFGDKPTKDGTLIRDLDDETLFTKMMERYPGDRGKISEEVEVENPLPVTPQQKTLKDRFATVAEKAKVRFGRMVENTFQSDERLSSKLLQNTGEVAGFVGDIGAEALGAITPDFIKEPVKQFIGETAGQVAESETGQMIGEAWQSIPEEERQNLEAIGNIAGVVPVGKGAQLAVQTGKEAVENVVETGVKTVTTELEKQAVKKGAKEAEKAYADAIDITAPVMNKKDSIAAFKRAGEPGGVVAEGGLKRYEVAPDARAREIADDTYGLVSSKVGPIENIGSVNTRIKGIAETEVRPFLQQHNFQYNPLQLETFLKQLPKPLSLKANPETFRAYNAVIQTAMQIAKKYPPTGEGLWDARKAIDDMIEKEFGDAAFDSASGIGARRAALSIRSGINDFISEGLGGGDLDLVNKVNDFIREARKRGIEIDNPEAVKKQMVASGAQGNLGLEIPDEELLKAFWKAKLREMNNLYIAQENMAERAYKLLGKNAIERWLKTHPTSREIGKQVLLWGGLGSASAIGAAVLSD